MMMVVRRRMTNEIGSVGSGFENKRCLVSFQTCMHKMLSGCSGECEGHV